MWSYPFLWKSTHVTFCKVSPVCFISPRFLDHVPVELLFSISGDLQVWEKWRKIFFLGVVGYKITPKRWKPSQENNTEGGNIGAQCSTDNLSSTISEFGQCYITGHWVGFKEVKNATLWLHILHWHFVVIFFFIKKLSFYHFHFFCIKFLQQNINQSIGDKKLSVELHVKQETFWQIKTNLTNGAINLKRKKICHHSHAVVTSYYVFFLTMTCLDGVAQFILQVMTREISGMSIGFHFTFLFHFSCPCS